MKSNIFSRRYSGSLKFATLICVLSILLSACAGTPAKPTPGAANTPIPSSATAQSSSSPESAENLLATSTLAPTLSSTNQLGADLLPSDTPEGDFLPTDQIDSDFQATLDASGFDQTPIADGTDTIFFGTTSPADNSSQDLGTGNETPVPEATRTVQFNPTPAGVPLGSDNNPVILGIVVSPNEQDTTRLDSSTQLASQLSQQTGVTIQVQAVNSNAELLNGMQTGAIHMAWLQPFTYILASRRGYAKVALVTNHFGVYAYGAQFMANARDGYTSFFNAPTNKSTGTAQDALAQFDGKRPCWVDPLSASGYVLPAGLLAEEKVTTEAPLYVLSHTAVIRALYITGLCDFGVTFSTYGDPRTSTNVQEDLPDVMQKVVIIWQTDAVIPNLNLSFNTTVPADMSKKIASAVSDMILGEDGRLLITAANGYDIQDVKAYDDTFYDPLRQAVIASRVNLITLLGK